MLREIDSYYENKKEPAKSCMLAARHWILKYNTHMTEAWKYRMPMFCYKGKMFCYLWTNKKTGQPYLGIVEGGKIDHPLLIQEKRSRMKIMMLNPEEDLPIEVIDDIFKRAIQFYK